MERFWGGCKDEGNKTHCRAWKYLAVPKVGGREEGGEGGVGEGRLGKRRVGIQGSM